MEILRQDETGWLRAGLVILIGVLLRIFLFPDIPPGLNQDEAATGFEAYSILTTGKDQWGNPYPVHFPGWGAGQSVLYAYLTIPAVKIFGLTVAATRSTALIIGILTLPLTFALAKRLFDRDTALLVLLFTAVLPWSVMIARWGLDANLLPFTLLLGCWCVERSLDQSQLKFWMAFALVPWALSLYAYGLALLVTPFLMLLVCAVYWREIIGHWRRWFVAGTVFGLVSAPLLLFVLKDYVLKSAFWFEDYLPFTIPLLPAQRLGQVDSGLWDNLTSNIQFIISGYNDGLIWNTYPPFLPLFLLPLPFLLIGLLTLAFRPVAMFRNLYFLWLVACIPLLLMIEINVNRGNALFLPVIAVSAFGLRSVIRWISNPSIRKAATLAAALWIVTGTLIFAVRFFQDYPAQAATSFRADLSTALEAANENAQENEPILVTDSIPLDYVNVLYLQKISPRIFHKTVTYSVDEAGLYDVHAFGSYVFDIKTLIGERSDNEQFIFVFKSSETAPCKSAPIFKSDAWLVGRCAIGELTQ